MPAIYSERFLMCEGNAVTRTVTVPPRKRWVLRDFLLSRVGDTGGANVAIGALWAIVFNFPATQFLVALDIRIVAYAGETVKIVTYGSSTWATLSGYAFDDPTGAVGPPADAIAGEIEIPEIL